MASDGERQIVSQHCKHVAQMWQERNELSSAGILLKARVDSLAAALQQLVEMGGLSDGGAANRSPFGCHCRCLDTVSERITAVEQGLNNAGNFLQRITAIEKRIIQWDLEYNTSPSAPIREPPGFMSHGYYNGPQAGGGGAANGATHDESTDVEMFFDTGPVTVGALSKLFDDKIANSNEYTYEGGDSGDHWLAKARGYLVSKCTAMMPILKWAERFGDMAITKDKIEKEDTMQKWFNDASLLQVGGALWGFLNLCLKKEALTCFKGATMLNGLDAWRRITNHARRGKNVRLDSLRKKVRNPEPIRRLEDVSVGIMKFENVISDYIAAGGSPPKPQEMKSDLLDALPLEVRVNLLWKSTNEEESFSSFINFVNQNVHHILDHRGKYSQLPISAVEASGSAEWVKEGNRIGDMEEVIGAMMKKMGVTARRDGGGGGGQRMSGQRDQATKCANCGSVKHTKLNCPLPKVPFDKRPCHGCGKPGHMAANCPEKSTSGGRPARMVDLDEPQPETFCVFDADAESRRGMDDDPEFTVVKKRPGRPMPARITLNDFVATETRNKFAALDEHKTVNQIKREKKKIRRQAERDQPSSLPSSDASFGVSPPALQGPAKGTLEGTAPPLYRAGCLWAGPWSAGGDPGVVRGGGRQ